MDTGLRKLNLSPKSSRSPDRPDLSGPNRRRPQRQSTLHPAGPSKRTRHRKRWYVMMAVVLILAGIFIWSSASSSTSVFKYVQAIAKPPPLKSTDNRVNILLLGNGGGNHDGALLTDSMIVASYNLANHDVTMFSIPRDLWVQQVNEKINALYEIGNDKGKGRGLSYAEEQVGQIMGTPIHYGVVIDFDGFSKAVDLVGGIDVNVPDAFDDYDYPVTGKEDDLCGNTQQEMDLTPEEASASGLQPGKQLVLMTSRGKIASSDADFACRFQHVHFDKGKTHMDGTTALEFVRSRHGTNGEGSDFARSRRQQLVIQAFKTKVFSVQTLVNPEKLIGLISTFGDNFQTDILQGNYLQLYGLVKSATRVTSVVLGDLGEGQSLFINPPISEKYGGAWVLTTPSGDYTALQDLVKSTLLKN